MRKVILVFAMSLVVVASSLATAAQAQDKTCKALKTQADCTANKACDWNGAKNSCRNAQKK